jgi:hypothetical protein
VGDPADGDVLEGGGPPRLGPGLNLRFRPPPLGPRGRWTAGIGGALAAVVVVALLQRHAVDPPPVAAPTSTVEVTATPAPEPAVLAPPLPPSRSVTGPGFLDPAARWELFARTDTEIDRIQPRAARVTRTAVPRLLSTGPVSFVVTPDRALVRPLDFVPGVELRDGRPPRPIAATLAENGPMFPGPDPGHVWVASGPDLVLRPVGGGPDTTRVPQSGNGSLEPPVEDGAGGLLFPGPTGVYVPGRTGLRRISPGALLAVGARGWIVAECNDAHRCRSELIDRATGARRDVGPPLTVGPLPGLISPDGRTVALYRIEDTGHIELDILDIASGQVRAADVEVEQELTVGMIAWSPDGRLFAITEGGAIRVIDRDSGRAGPMGPPLPAVRQLAIRTLP